MHETLIISSSIKEIISVVHGIHPTATIENYKGVVSSIEVVVDDSDYAFNIFLDHGNETLTLIGEVGFPHAGFSTTAAHWNANEIIGPLLTLTDGYALRFDINISHGVTKASFKDALKDYLHAFRKLIAHRETKGEGH